MVQNVAHESEKRQLEAKMPEKRLGSDIWAAARARWEADPDLTLAAVALELGVSRPTVSLRAKRESWFKQGVPLKPVEALAQVAADALNDPQRFLLVDDEQEVLDLSIGARVRVINRHRNDWEEHRALFPSGAMASDPTAARRAKFAAEVIALRQRGECLAHGLITFSGQDTNAPLVDEVPAEEPSDFDRAMRHLLETGELPPWQKGSLPVEDVSPRAVEAPARSAEQEVEDAPYR